MQDKHGPQSILETLEGKRLLTDEKAWRRWGPYLAERQWGTVREDYSADGDPWSHFPFEHAHRRAYRWGEDGLAGFCDEQARWCLSLALWNGKDRQLKERLFGLSNGQGNHGEDVKELYFFQDGVPSHAYMRMLYRYPQAAFPYEKLIAENAARDCDSPEYEISETGVFDAGRYFDITVEYAKADTDDILQRITIHNIAGEEAFIAVMPQLTARNIWSWDSVECTEADAHADTHADSTMDLPGVAASSETQKKSASSSQASPGSGKPVLQLDGTGVRASRADMDTMRLDAQAGPHGEPRWMFCENESNPALFGLNAGDGLYKDGINACIVHDRQRAVRGDRGSKCAAHYPLHIGAGQCVTLRLRWRRHHEAAITGTPFDGFDDMVAMRRREADLFYAALQHRLPKDHDGRLVQRQALAGLLWSKQYYGFDVRRWLRGDHDSTPPAQRWSGRNHDWQHLCAADVLAMPDTWEYPWFASWDLAFHAVSYASIDPSFAKSQLLMLVHERYMHPNGQIPAYEWNFGDANPPVFAWATWRVYQMETALRGSADNCFLERMFHKLMLNFSWWVNRKDAQGRNIFQGGFLGLDNIQVFDRSDGLPDGSHLDQPDATGWMAAYALTMMRMALELAVHNRSYVDLAVKFFEHFLYISAAMSERGDDATNLWNEEDGFFYDLLHRADGSSAPLRVRSLAGVVPMFAVHILEPDVTDRVPEFGERLKWFLSMRPELTELISRWTEPNGTRKHMLALLRSHRTKALLRRLLDENEFLSPHGLRSVSRSYSEHPFEYNCGEHTLTLHYVPAESDSRMFGGNSNWRGPVWMPLNCLLIEALYEYHRYYGDEFRVECPTGSGNMASLAEVADMLSMRLARLSLCDQHGRRAVMASYPQLQQNQCGQAGDDSLVLFHEYYDGDTGAGLGAAHQTGWSAMVALLLMHRHDDQRGKLPSCD